MSSMKPISFIAAVAGLALAAFAAPAQAAGTGLIFVSNE